MGALPVIRGQPRRLPGTRLEILSRIAPDNRGTTAQGAPAFVAAVLLRVPALCENFDRRFSQSPGSAVVGAVVSATAAADYINLI